MDISALRWSLAAVLAIVTVLLAISQPCEAAIGPAAIVRSLLQNNIVGAPVIHRITKWDFDPDVAVRRRDQYEELHGYRGEKLIERLGLGVDGYAAERLTQQQQRDVGKLGGVLALQPTDQV